MDRIAASSLEGVFPTLTYYLGSGTSGTVLDGAPTNIGTYTVVAFFGGSDDYAPAQSESVTFTISPATLTVSGVTAENKVYDGTNAATLDTAGAALQGMVSGDVVTLETAGATGTFASKDVAAGITVTISGLAIDGQQAANYTLVQPTTTANISPEVPVSGNLVHDFLVQADPATVTAGAPFLYTVTALDATGQTVTGYSGTVSLTTSDSQGVLLPTNGTISGGVGYFITTLKTVGLAGTQTITATDSVNQLTGMGTFTVSAAATTQFVVSGAPASILTGSPFSLTVTAEDAYGNLTPSYHGTVSFSSTDAAAVAEHDLPANYTFTIGASQDNGTHTFTGGVTLLTPGTQTVTASELGNANLKGTSSAVTVTGLQVTSVTGTPTGFTVTFNKPFAISSLHLYSSPTSPAMPDLLFFSPLGIPLTGSVVPNATHTAFTFVETTEPDQLGSLADGTYIVSLLSGASGLSDTSGVPLDVSNNPDTADYLYPLGTSVYTNTFTLTNATAASGITDSNVALSLPAFTQGPGLPVQVQVPFTTNPVQYFGDIYTVNGNGDTVLSGGAPGIPVTLSDGDNLSTVSFQVTYDTTLLTVSGAEVDPGLATVGFPDASFTRTPGPVVSGMETDTFTFNAGSAGALPQGPGMTGQVPGWTLGELLATVPNTANQTIYRAKQLLTVTSVAADNGVVLPVVGGAGFQLVAYLGDGSGDGALTTADAAQAAAILGVFSNYTGSVRAQAYVTTGFANYPNVDPAVVADTDATEIVDGGAVAGLALVGAGFSVPSIPSPPKGANVLTTGAPDPDLSLPSLVTARGGVVSVPVMLDSAMPAGSTGLTEATLALTYDPHVLSVADVHLGNLPALGTGWTVTSVVDAAGGQLAIELYSPTPLDVAAAGSLVQVDFDVLPGAVGSTTVNLVGAVDPNGGRWFSTNLADSQGAMALGTSTAAASVTAFLPPWVKTRSPLAS